MAKAKKTETAAAGSTRKKSVKPKTSESTGAPLVDTNLAAQVAARRVVAGLAPAGAASGTVLPQSASFKHLKETLNNPNGGGLAGLLDKTTGSDQKKSNLPFKGGKQTGRNQTFGADVNRTGVPRRTGGG